MCLGALMSAEVGRLVIGGSTALGTGRSSEYSVERFVQLTGFADRISVTTGVLQPQCEELVGHWRAQQSDPRGS